MTWDRTRDWMLDARHDGLTRKWQLVDPLEGITAIVRTEVFVPDDFEMRVVDELVGTFNYTRTISGPADAKTHSLIPKGVSVWFPGKYELNLNVDDGRIRLGNGGESFRDEWFTLVYGPDRTVEQLHLIAENAFPKTHLSERAASYATYSLLLPLTDPSVPVVMSSEGSFKLPPVSLSGFEYNDVHYSLQIADSLNVTLQNLKGDRRYARFPSVISEDYRSALQDRHTVDWIMMSADLSENVEL